MPRSQLHSISCGRGSQSSRYVDLVATLDATEESQTESSFQETLEFTNIDREELQVVNGYIQVLIKAMKEDIRTAEKKEEDLGDPSVMHAVEVIESDQEEEEDVAEDSKRRKRKQRMVSKDAREATRQELISNSDDNDGSDDDDDDYNFVEVLDDGDGEQDSENDESNGAIEIVDEDSTSSNDDGVEVVAVKHKKRRHRISSQEAMEATSVELKNYEGHSEDEDEDYNFVEKGDYEDDDVELHVDSDEDDDEQFMDESETEEATDSEDETNEPAKKKSKNR